MFLEVYDSREVETGGPLNAGKTAHGNHQRKTLGNASETARDLPVCVCGVWTLCQEVRGGTVFTHSSIPVDDSWSSEDVMTVCRK